MRLVISLLLASLSATVSVLLVYAWISVGAHRQSWLDDTKEDHRAMAGMLIEAMETVAERHGVRYAQELVEDVNARKDNVHFEWLPTEQPGGQAERGVTHVSITEDAGEGEPRLETRAGVFIAGAPAGTLLLIESSAAAEEIRRRAHAAARGHRHLDDRLRNDRRRGRRVFLVARRVRAMVSQARRVAAGELDRRIENLGPGDELGELGRELNAMTDRLAQARDELEEQNAARLRAIDQLRHGERLMTVGKLAAGIAHELGTPLNVVTVSAKMIANGEATGPDVPEYAEVIAEQGARMSRILGELMDFARRRAPERTDVDLRTIAESTCVLLAPLAHAHEIRLLVTGADSKPLRVDAGQIQQVLTNLVANAIYASQPGADVTVEIGSRTAVDPSVPGAAPRPCATMRVRDDGTGVAPEHLDRIFEPFFTTKDVGVGTGLGLSVAYGLVIEHGGWITVDSVSGGGSVFEVMLPTDGGESADGGDARPI